MSKFTKSALAAATLAALVVPAAATDYFYRAKPQTIEVAAPVVDLSPDVLTGIPTVTSELAATSTLSGTVRISGHTGVAVSVTGPGAQLRVCTVDACASGVVGAWVASAARIDDGAYVQLKMNSGAAGATVTARLTYGDKTADWQLKTAVAPTILAAARSACSGTWTKVATLVSGSIPDTASMTALINGKQYLAAFADASSGTGYNYFSKARITLPASACSSVGPDAMRMVTSSGTDTSWRNVRSCIASAIYMGNFDHPAVNGWSDSFGSSFGRLSKAPYNAFTLTDTNAAYFRIATGDGMAATMTRLETDDRAEIYTCN
jgi:hypothetical protein